MHTKACCSLPKMLCGYCKFHNNMLSFPGSYKIKMYCGLSCQWAQTIKKERFQLGFPMAWNVPEQKNPCPAVLLTRVKGRSKNFKNCQTNFKFVDFFFIVCKWLQIDWTNICPASCGAGQAIKILPRLVQRQDFDLVPLSLCPGQWRDICPFVARDKKILFRWKA